MTASVDILAGILRFPSRRSSSLALAMLLAGVLSSACTIGPNYQRPATAVPASFKEAPPGWKVAQPDDRAERGNWWEIFDDATLNGLIEAANRSNQSIIGYQAAYRQASALVAQARAGYAPTVSGSASGTRSGSGNRSTGTSAGSSVSNSYSTSLNASWEPDLWGSVSRDVAGERASRQSAEANLANARLSVQGTLAQDYFQLRSLDATQALYDRTVAAYQQSLNMTQFRYNAGVAGRQDVVTAQTQLQSAQAAAVDNRISRDQYEHAIAVLVGEPASTFSLPAMPLTAQPPTVPLALPSTLLERRPDVAAAERTAAAANEQIGIAQAAFFPTLSLSASGGFTSATLANWLTAPARVWSLGPSLAATFFDGGLRTARVEAARATYDQDAANYRATVLAAFQDVEDNLSSVRVLANEEIIQRQAAASADLALTIVTNSYKAGTTTFLDVLTAQATAFSAQRTLVDVQGRRMVAAAGLIKALGGGWNGLASSDAQAAAMAVPASAASPSNAATPGEPAPSRQVPGSV